jgi:hypothetical protein
MAGNLPLQLFQFLPAGLLVVLEFGEELGRLPPGLLILYVEHVLLECFERRGRSSRL